jgi:hypothetical protein
MMILPDDILGLIRDFSRPIGLRLDWKMGCYIKQNSFLDFATDISLQQMYIFRLRHYSSYVNFYLL